MGSLIILAILILVVGYCLKVLFGGLLTKSPLRKKAGSEFSLPGELKGARLVLCEPKDNLYVTAPFNMHGKPDEVYGVGNRLVVLDTKERNFAKVYDDDVVKLSMYASILRNHKDYRQYVSSTHAYLRIVNRQSRKVSFAKVDLLNDAQLLRLKQKRDAVVSGQVSPSTSRNKNFCKGCAQRKACPNPAV
jgi:hypothetical protein